LLRVEGIGPETLIVTTLKKSAQEDPQFKEERKCQKILPRTFKFVEQLEDFALWSGPS
jgi:hypothetical protein